MLGHFWTEGNQIPDIPYLAPRALTGSNEIQAATRLRIVFDI
jgi:hypothetical protein